MGRDCCGCATEVQLSSNYNLVSRSTLLSAFPPTFKNKIEKARVSRFAFSSVRTLVVARTLDGMSRACPARACLVPPSRILVTTVSSHALLFNDHYHNMPTFNAVCAVNFKR